MIMRVEKKNLHHMTDRELRAYRRVLRRKKETRRRCMILVMTLCLILIGTFSYHGIKLSASTADKTVNFKYFTNITVGYGETLWDIADEYIDYQEYKDKREYIAEVQSINHMEGDELRAGQHLIVPYYSTEFVY